MEMHEEAKPLHFQVAMMRADESLSLDSVQALLHPVNGSPHPLHAIQAVCDVSDLFADLVGGCAHPLSQVLHHWQHVVRLVQHALSRVLQLLYRSANRLVQRTHVRHRSWELHLLLEGGEGLDGLGLDALDRLRLCRLLERLLHDRRRLLGQVPCDVGGLLEGLSPDVDAHLHRARRSRHHRRTQLLSRAVEALCNGSNEEVTEEGEGGPGPDGGSLQAFAEHGPGHCPALLHHRLHALPSLARGLPELRVAEGAELGAEALDGGLDGWRRLVQQKRRLINRALDERRGLLHAAVHRALHHRRGLVDERLHERL
mmetsp:Transcript_21127/g.42905  ORF Transcript_21127/g.42905 Transcript_21127/m.42905 type:complete len:314 (-) Transcript_21127:35-976(-)